MIKIIGLLTVILLFPFCGFPQGANSQLNRLISSVDESLNIKRVAVAPFTDNVSQIYANRLQPTLNELVAQDQQWSLINLPSDFQANYKVGSFNNNRNILSLLRKNQLIDAVITGHLIQGQKGIQIQLQIISTLDAQVLAQSELSDYKGFEITEIQAELRTLFKSLKDSLPYRAMILSRRGNQVTINLGKNYGLKEKDELTVVQFLKLNRHPKHQFVVSSEKEIIGKVQLFKVDAALAFGAITFEKETGVVQQNSKIIAPDFKSYTPPVLGPDGKILRDLEGKDGAQIAFGQNPEEWTPVPPPQFGRVGISLGLEQHAHKTNLQTAGGLTATQAFVPNIMFDAEMWFSANWTAGFRLRQSVFSLSNELSGSAPSTLNGSLNQYEGRVLYNVLLTDEFFGPKWILGAGFQQSQLNIDESTPLAYTSHNYGGMYLNLGGSFPVSETTPFNLGADLRYFITKSLSEGDTSGVGTVNMNSFSVHGTYQVNPRYQVKGEMLFEYFNASLNGSGSRADPATSTSHRMTTFFLGLEYLF